ncbi:hypothetical protein LSCM1_02402 [Leishmania martiniquensis]|uniref:Uncharacterized protein n=1 Tax=Leishmania martiniquensis TaxID=1580590 RepID=A0A836GIQ1_9TRYP|nr:hypothetical protein LSCM1_02402 [Leishmania martiniquensis]
MVLPPALRLGPHEVRILPICRSAEIAPGVRRCSDSLLTAFCFVGELQPDAAEGSGEISDAAGDSSSRGVPILWYYSPLFQYERKRIRVEEGVVEAALTKTVAAYQHPVVNSPSLELGGAEAYECKGSCPVRRSEAPSAALKVACVPAVPALYLRVGSSTTFREYGLVMEERQSAALGASAEPCTQGGADVTGGGDGERSERAARKPPFFAPLKPKRPSLRPIDRQLHGSDLQSMLRLLHRQTNFLHRGSPLVSALAQVGGAQVEDLEEKSRQPRSPSKEASSALLAAPFLRSESDGDDGPHEFAASVSLSLVREEERRASCCEPRAEQWVKPEVCACKDVPRGSYRVDGAGSSSVSSALFSRSLLCLAFPDPTSELSTLGSVEAETDDFHSCSTGPSDSCDRLLNNAHLHSLAVTCLAFDTFTPLTMGASCPTPPAAPKPRFARRLPLHTFANNNKGLPLSTHALHAPAVQGIWPERESAIAATPQISR